MTSLSCDPFITYQGSTDQAVHDIDHLKTTQKLTDPTLWRHPAAQVIKSLLRSHVKSKKGLETVFVQDLAHIYALTRLLTAIGFSTNDNAAHKAFLAFNTARSRLKLLRPYHIDTYQRATFPNPPSSPKSPGQSSSPVSVAASVDNLARWRNLSMLMGMIMSILQEYDEWLEQIRDRMAASAEATTVLTIDEETKLQKTYEDVYYMSKELLGDLAGKIDAAIKGGE
jgi:hypothetical protein